MIPVGRLVPKVGLVLGLIPATLGLSDPVLNDGILNTLIASSLLCVGPWVLQNADWDVT